MKVHIIGVSGSGKSYLARLLSNKLNIIHFDLDNVYWDNSTKYYGVKNSEERRDSLLNDMLQEENYIIEGVYYSWLNNSFEQADYIVLLDIPKRLYIFRIIFRYLKRRLGLEKSKKENLKSLAELIKWTKKYEEQHLPKIKIILKKYRNKGIILHNKKEIKDFLENFER